MGRRSMPQQRPGQSEQAVETPDEFLQAVKRRLGIFAFGLDIAASGSNAKAKRYFTRADNALLQLSWKSPGKQWSWINPPFGEIAPFAARCLEEKHRQGSRIALLVPAAVGANWWSAYVHRKAHVLFLNGRIQFVGHDHGYPKDLALVLYSPDLKPGYDCWRWKN